MPVPFPGSTPMSAATLPVWAGSAERLRFLLGWAVLAPSKHNVQPWLFEIEGEEVRLYGDFRRALPTSDPRDRELAIGCGAALLNLRLAAAHFGYATSAEILAAGRRDGLFARLRLEERRAATPEEDLLFAAIARRRTNRLPLDSREPASGLVAELARGAGVEGAVLRPVEEKERLPVAELVAEGDRLHWADSRFRSETAAWTRSNASRRRDGVPGFAHGMGNAASVVQPWLVRIADAGPAEAERDRRRAMSARALLLLCTRGDEPRDWVAAGEALQRVLLRATASDLYASYFNSPLEIAALRRELCTTLGETGCPQVMFRLGYGLEVRPTPRRPVSEVVRSVSEHAAAPAPLAVRQ